MGKQQSRSKSNGNDKAKQSKAQMEHPSCVSVCVCTDCMYAFAILRWVEMSVGSAWLLSLGSGSGGGWTGKKRCR